MLSVCFIFLCLPVDCLFHPSTLPTTCYFYLFCKIPIGLRTVLHHSFIDWKLCKQVHTTNQILIKSKTAVDNIYISILQAFRCLNVLDGDLNLYSRLDGDGRDLLHNLSRGLEVDEARGDAHLKSIPSFGTFTARGLTSGDAQHLGGHADRALHLELLLLGTADKVSADLFEVADVAGGQSDADAVNLRGVSLLNTLFNSSGFHCSSHLQQ